MNDRIETPRHEPLDTARADDATVGGRVVRFLRHFSWQSPLREKDQRLVAQIWRDLERDPSAVLSTALAAFAFEVDAIDNQRPARVFRPGAIPYFLCTMSNLAASLGDYPVTAEGRPQATMTDNLCIETMRLVVDRACGGDAVVAEKYRVGDWFRLASVLTASRPETVDAIVALQKDFWRNFGQAARERAVLTFNWGDLSGLAGETAPAAASVAGKVIMSLEDVRDPKTKDRIVPYPVALGLSSILAAKQGRVVDNIRLMIGELDLRGYMTKRQPTVIEGSAVLADAMRAVYPLDAGDALSDMRELSRIFRQAMPFSVPAIERVSDCAPSIAILEALNAGALAARRADVNEMLVQEAKACSKTISHLPDLEEATLPWALRRKAKAIIRRNGPVYG